MRGEEFWCTVLVWFGLIYWARTKCRQRWRSGYVVCIIPILSPFHSVGRFPSFFKRIFFWGLLFLLFFLIFLLGLGQVVEELGRETNTMNIPYILSRTENTIFELWCSAAIISQRTLSDLTVKSFSRSVFSGNLSLTALHPSFSRSLLLAG